MTKSWQDIVEAAQSHEADTATAIERVKKIYEALEQLDNESALPPETLDWDAIREHVKRMKRKGYGDK